MNGTNSIQLPDTSITYFNADYTNSNVDAGNLPWIIGLAKQKNSGNFNIQTTDYDTQGSVRSDAQAGRITKYKYETRSFSSCLGDLANFQWSNFIGCMSSYVFGDQHIGLPIEVDVGNGKQVTQFAAYQKGVPTRIKLASGGVETNVVDEFGNIIFHADADGVRSQNQYDDAGRLKVETPIIGLAETIINYDGLTISKTVNGGASFNKTEKYNGDGLLIWSEDRASDKSIVNSNKYDAFGNLLFKSNSSLGGTNSGVTTSYDMFNRPISVNDNGSTVTYCYQSCSGRTGAIARTTDVSGFTESNFLAVGDFGSDLKTWVSRKGGDGSVFQTTTEYELAILKPRVAVSGNSVQSYTYNANATLATEKDNGINGQKAFNYDDTGRIIAISHPDSSVENIGYAPLNDSIATRNWRGVTTTYLYSLAGRLKSNSNGNTTQVFDRDNYGRVESHTQIVAGNDLNQSYTTRYGYNALGQITSIIYPNGKSVNLTSQNAFGEITTIPNVIQSLGYNALHQLTSVQANPDVMWTYSYSENGLPSNVSAIGLDKCIVNIGYGYDALNRINKLNDNCGAIYNATINRYGTGLMSSVDLDQAYYQYSYNNDDITSVNITSKSANVTPAIYTYNYANNTSRLNNVTGSAYSFSYDAMGNVTNDGIRTLTYDSYGRMNTNGSETYIYNADGLRVRAIRDDGITDYVYGLDGNLAYDINHKTGYSKAYVYVADKLVATLERYPDDNKGFDFVNDFEAAELGITNLLDSYIDSDDDGLPDYLERFIGSDPNNPDTDGDGHKDGYEYEQLGAKGVLNPNIKPTEPDPKEDMAAWLPPILDMLLEDD